MKLLRYRVTGFRSVDDSGWIETDDVSALIGENESGKTNLLLPLWKLNPARDGAIDLVSDCPRKHFAEIRAAKNKPTFITAQFRLSDEIAGQVSALTGASMDAVRVAEVSRHFDGTRTVGFPEDVPTRLLPSPPLKALLAHAIASVAGVDSLKTEEKQVEALEALLAVIAAEAEAAGASIGDTSARSMVDRLQECRSTFIRPTSAVAPVVDSILIGLRALVAPVDRAPAHNSDEARALVEKELPTFVYYSSYGNLDSEIYLPHVIENLNRDDLGPKEAAKARTLRVLFEFVGVSPTEILALGQETSLPAGTRPTGEQISTDAKRKQEREVLLQSAGAKLTREFRAWWKRGNYQFRFQADGNHFRIWVHDELRPEDIELENRSTGLQWFLSFYLVFLVERASAHADAILLLDEPGLSLHPLAQRDLSNFFEGLADSNQLLYTTHSPFLVDPNHLDRVKAVFVDELGLTRCSPDLRAGERGAGKRSSVYPVYAALGISVSDVLLLGCQVVLVEGMSDQYVLTALKNLLLTQSKLAPPREIVFIPASGTKSIRPITSLLAGPNEELPVVILDGDQAGRDLATALRTNLYAAHRDRVLVLSDFTGRLGDEIEDLLNPAAYADLVDRHLKLRDIDFASTVAPDRSIVSQVEAFAARNGVALAAPGWKVEVAKLAKERLTRAGASAVLDDGRLQLVERLFQAIIQ